VAPPLEVVATNLLLTLLVVLLFGLTSSVFNSTIDDNRRTIEGWLARARSTVWNRTPVVPGAAAVVAASPIARVGGPPRFLVVLVITALVYGFLSPDFGLTPTGVTLFASLLVGLGLVTYLSEGEAAFLARRRLRVGSDVRLYAAAILVAISCVAVSRLIDFKPGFVYGFVASSVLIAPVAISRRATAGLVLVPAVTLVCVSLIAWLLMGPLVAAANTDGSWVTGLAASIAATVFVAGLEGTFYNLLPFTFMDGAAVYRWSRIAWALAFGTATFLFWQLLVNQYHSYLDAFRQTSVITCLAILAVYGGLTALAWLYFRRRRAAEERAEAAAE
jgi:hypothetical protein